MWLCGSMAQFQNYTISNMKNGKIRLNKISKVRNGSERNNKWKVRHADPPQNSNFQILRFMKRIRKVSINFLYSLKSFWHICIKNEDPGARNIEIIDFGGFGFLK